MLTINEKFAEDRRRFLIRLISPDQLRERVFRYLEDSYDHELNRLCQLSKNQHMPYQHTRVAPLVRPQPNLLQWILW